MTVARSSHGTPSAAVELPQQQPAEGEFRRMSGGQMTESHSVFIKLIFCPRIEAHTSRSQPGFSQARHCIGIVPGRQNVSRRKKECRLGGLCY